MRLETPQVLRDLYRDLRDRRLLIPVVGLLVAILAVPLVLASGDETVTPAAVAAPPEGAEQVSAAVLAEQPGIRNYRERLSALKEQNPFDPAFKARTPESTTEDTGAAATSGATSGSAVPTGDSSTSTSTAGATTPSDPAPDTSAPAPTEPTSEVPDSETDQPKPEIRFFVGRVDVSFGPVGDAKTIEDVRELDLLPGDKNPLVSFIGLAGNGGHAVFGITPSVVQTRGDGSCAPKDGCQFLRLGEGDSRYLKTEGETYKLKLVETHLVRIPDPRD